VNTATKACNVTEKIIYCHGYERIPNQWCIGDLSSRKETEPNLKESVRAAEMHEEKIETKRANKPRPKSMDTLEERNVSCGRFLYPMYIRI